MDVVAGYAALVATGSLGWQVYSAREARRPGIRVTVALAGLTYPAGVEWTVCVTAANRGERPVSVSGAGLRLQDQSRRTLVKLQSEPFDTLPGTIEPHHSGQQFIRRDFVEQNGIVLTQPLVAFANLATGETVTSKPTRLLKP